MHNISTEYSDCSTAKATFQAQYDHLAHLPVDSLLPSLFANGVITFDQKEEIEELPQKKKKMEFILDAIIRSLNVGVGDLYNGFLKVMEESKDLVTRKLVKKLGKLGVAT